MSFSGSQRETWSSTGAEAGRYWSCTVRPIAPSGAAKGAVACVPVGGVRPMRSRRAAAVALSRCRFLGDVGSIDFDRDYYPAMQEHYRAQSG